jgi:hypothetical protein
VFVQLRRDLAANGMRRPPQHKMICYKLDLVEHELVPVDGNATGVKESSAIEFVSDFITHFEPLPFGGFLAFDHEFVYYYVDG